MASSRRGRPKKYTIPYTGDKQQMEAAFREYLSCVVDCFGEPYDDRDCGENNPSARHYAASLRDVCDEFSISIPKARKLLITAGVYSTEKSRLIAELSAQGKDVEEIAALTGLSRSSVSSYLPYRTFSYNMAECSRHAEDSRKYRDRRRTVEELHKQIALVLPQEDLDVALWQCVLAFQNYSFYTTSGLPFSYTVKKKKNGEYSGELVVSRKAESKTLTKSSVLLAFHKVLEAMDPIGAPVSPEFKGPKAIGQIFGISYVYSLFWKWGMIKVPGKVEEKLRGRRE